MTEDHSELNLCPNCGKENLSMATRCVHCGSEMESLFTIFGQSQAPDEEAEDSLPDIIEEIRNDPSLLIPAEPEPSQEVQHEDQTDEAALPADQLPDWLAKVRERAQVEEDAIGDLVSGTIAMDAARSEEGSAGVEGEFNAWINRIREKTQQDASARVRQIPSEPEEPDQVPEWLQRIRALRPRPEEEITHEVKTPAPYADDLPLEWTDEALQELRRKALAEDHELETEIHPSASLDDQEQELPAEPEAELPGEPVQDEVETPEEDFHNIPNDEEEYHVPVPDEDLGHLKEVDQETVPEQIPEQEPEIVETEALELWLEPNPEESAEDLAQPETQPTAEFGAEEPPAEPETKETPEQDEVQEAILEEESELPIREPAEEPDESDQPGDSAAVPPNLLLLRDQQDRASLLASLIEQEGRVTAHKKPTRKPSGRAGRLVVALMLLVGLIISILIGPVSIPADTSKSLPAMALSEQIQSLTKDDKVLIVLDYQAATSRELEALAAPVLAQLHAQDAQLAFVTSQPSGLFLAQSLLEQAGLPENTQVEYLPGSYLNLIGWAVTPAISATGDDLVTVKNLGYFKLVLMVSDSSDNIRGWLEQIAPWISSLKFAAVTTQMEATVLLPYFDSGQLVGYAAGSADGNIGSQTSFNYRAYRVGLLLMLVMLLLGMISKGEEDAIRKEEEGAE